MPAGATSSWTSPERRAWWGRVGYGENAGRVGRSVGLEGVAREGGNEETRQCSGQVASGRRRAGRELLFRKCRGRCRMELRPASTLVRLWGTKPKPASEAAEPVAVESGRGRFRPRSRDNE